MRLACGIGFVAVLAILSTSTPAGADMLGVRTGFYTDAQKPFVGVELLIPASHRVYINPNAEYIFADSRTYMTFNADFHYDFLRRGRNDVWAGGGLAVIYSNPKGPAEGSTDLGANFLFGAAHRGPVVPYVQAKLIAKSNPEFVIAVGLRF
jgi:hypothetical protein